MAIGSCRIILTFGHVLSVYAYPSSVPTAWLAGIAEGSIVFSTSAPDYRAQYDVMVNSTPIGNGIVATVVDLDAVYLGGLYNTFIELPAQPGWRVNSSARAQIPATVSTLSLAVNATIFALDARRAVYLARWGGLGPGGCITAERRVYAPRIAAALLVTELHFESSCSMNVSIPLRTTFRDTDVTHAPDLNISAVPSMIPGTTAFSGSIQTPEPKCFGLDELAATQVCMPTDMRQGVASVHDTLPQTVSVPPGRQTHTFIAAYGSTLNNTATPLAQARHTYGLAREWAVKGELFTVHEKGMKAMWSAEHGGGVILAQGGDVRLARGIWSALHGLLTSMSAAWGGGELEAAHGYSPGGLFGGGIRDVPSEDMQDNAGANLPTWNVDAGYLGHVFWDQEFFMFPPTLPLFPALAKAAMRYRTAPKRIAAAAAKARWLGWAGAYIPLESAETGYEQMWTAPKYGWEEIEGSGCVVWALEQTYRQSGDLDWLRDEASALIFAIAQFFASRMERCTLPRNTSQYCLNRVMGPDESHAPVNNSGFVSGIAAWSLESAVRVAGWLGTSPGANWSHIAANTYIVMNQTLRYHPEFEGFQIGTVVRQADIQLLQYPLDYKFAADVAANDILLYEKAISGPAMTYGLFAVMFMQNHASDPSFIHRAQVEFEKNYNYSYGPFNSFSEEPNGSGTPQFATGMGTFLQAVVQGWAGVRYIHMADRRRAVTLMPLLPLDGTTNLTIAGIHFGGSALTLQILQHHAELSLVAGGSMVCVYNAASTNHPAQQTLNVNEEPLLMQLGALVTCF